MSTPTDAQWFRYLEHDYSECDHFDGECSCGWDDGMEEEDDE